MKTTTPKIDNWFVMEDGTNAAPGDVSKGDDGIQRNKSGVPCCAGS